MDSLGDRFVGGSNVTRWVLMGFRFRAPKFRKTGNLNFRPAAMCSRFGRSGAVRAGMRSGLPSGKRLEKLRIWPPGVASRAGVLREVKEVAGVPEGVGRRNFRNPVFQKSGRWGIRGGRQKTLSVRIVVAWMDHAAFLCL